MRSEHRAFLWLIAIIWLAAIAMSITNTVLSVDRELVIRLVIDLEPLRKK